MTAASPCPVCPAEETAIIVAPHISSRDAVSIIPFQDTLRPRGHVISHTPRIQYSIHARHGFSMRDARCFASSFRIPFGTEAARFIHGHLRTYHTKPSFVFPVSVRARPGNAIVCSGEIMKTFNIEPSNRIHMAFIVTVIRDGMQSSGVSACWSASSMLICFIESDGRFMTQESLFRHDGNTFPPGTRHSICILLSYDSPSSPASRASVFFAGNADSLMSIRDWYSRFARLTGIMRKYMPGFVRWDMTMVSPSPVSCAVGHIENNSHNNTIHDFMISR